MKKKIINVLDVIAPPSVVFPLVGMYVLMMIARRAFLRKYDTD